jgi:hypothetical protein
MKVSNLIMLLLPMPNRYTTLAYHIMEILNLRNFPLPAAITTLKTSYLRFALQ